MDSNEFKYKWEITTENELTGIEYKKKDLLIPSKLLNLAEVVKIEFEVEYTTDKKTHASYYFIVNPGLEVEEATITDSESTNMFTIGLADTIDTSHFF